MKRFPSGYSSLIKIGQGSYSSVYRATQKKLDRIVVLKEFDKSISKAADEIQTLASLRLDCIPAIYDVKRSIHGITVVMEWIDGIPLDALTKHTLSASTRVHIGSRIINSLAKLHEAGVVHRDLKPQNIIIKSHGDAVLVDFGFSRTARKQTDDNDNRLTGTPAFMAPELWSAEQEIDYKKVDCYALGLVLEGIIGKEFPELLKLLLQVDPVLRPENASAFKKLWDEYTTTLSVKADPDEIPGIVKEYTAGVLLEGCKQLLSMKHFQEAYEVLAESLEIFPDNGDALVLLEKHFSNPAPSVISHTIMVPFLALVMLLCSLTGTFFLGRHFSHGSVLTALVFDSATVDERIQISHSGDKRKSFPDPTLPDLRSSLQPPAMHGEVTVLLPSGKGTLFVDGIKVAADAGNLYHRALEAGTHRFEWVDSLHQRRCIETADILPFEIKRLTLERSSDEK